MSAVSHVDLARAVLGALESARIGVAAVTPDGTRLYVNEAYAHLLGMTVDEALTHPATSPIAPEDRARVEALRSAYVERGELLPTLQTVFVAKDGTRVPVELATTAVTLGDRRALVLFTRDISSRVQMEHAVRSSETRFRALADGAPDGIAVHVRGRLAYANPQLLRMIGRSFEELAAAGIYTLLTDHEQGLMIERLARVAAGEKTPPHEYHMDLPGGPTWVEIHSIAFEHEGQPAVLSFARDVNERRRLLEELRRADRLAALGTLAAAVAHEVNNPLTYVLLQLGELRQVLADVVPGPQADAARAMVDVALEGAERVRVIVRDLLSFARSDPGSREAVAVDEALDAAIRVAGNVLRHRATVRRSYALVRPVAATKSRLEQVFLNLLVNAAQAIPEDAGEGAEIHVRIEPDGDDVVIEISDNGAGIAAADLPHVFEPFFTTKPEGVGTGLGLAICRTIVESLAGEIAVRCPPEGGTVVRVRLPATNMPPPRVAPHARARSTDTPRRGRLLVIDDEVRLARLLAALFEDQHAVEVATNGEQGLRLLRDSAPFDVVFCDLMMQDMTGMDLYEEACRGRPELAETFVFLTGGAFTERAARFVARPNVTTILKPFDLAEIEAAIRSRLRS